MSEKIQWKNVFAGAFAGLILGVVFNYFWDVRPFVSEVRQSIQIIAQTQDEIQGRIDRIEEKYLQKDNQGSNCKVGISGDLSGNCVSVFQDNKFGLKSQDIIYITNPFGLYTPTAAFVVYLVDGSDNNSDADLFLSKEGIEKLDIDKKNFRKGIFEMRFRRKEDQKN